MTALPHPDYPRPDRDRSDAWIPLDGPWDFESADGSATITVPFAWETAASGVGRTWLERATYRRSATAPPEWGGARTFLCFGAVHHHARVLVDGRPIGEHTGGHTSFEFDVTDALPPGSTAEIRVEVAAPSDKREIAHGKQRSIPRDDYDGVAFTPTSGIWQSVWLEARGRTHVTEIHLDGESLTGFDVSGRLAGDAPAGAAVRLRVRGTGEAVELAADAAGRFAGRLGLEAPRPWSPADPHLYRVDVAVAAEGARPDRLTVTGGLRSIETDGEHLRLNGERLYVRGVLDQGYWPRSGLTAPDHDRLVADLELARDLGYNLVRKHLKLEDPRWLHRADTLGMLVWAEPPAPSRYTERSAAAFTAQLAPMVERDRNHPSIVVWGLYNEEWGLDWDIPGSPERAGAAAAAYDALRALDRSRPVVENSGWAHVKSDLVDWHYYDEDPRTWADTLASLASGDREDFPVKLGPDFVVDKSFYGSDDFPRTGVPILNSEYGAGFTSLERGWHLRWQTQEIRRHDRFNGYVYTELADVEHEMAGLVDAERRPKDIAGLDPSDVNGETVLVVNLVPAAAGADIPVPAEPFTLEAHVSHHGAALLSGRVVAAWVPGGTPSRLAEVRADHVSAPFKAEPFVLSEAVGVRVAAPQGPARLMLWALDEHDAVRARTFVDAAPIEEPNRRGARREA
ncbi:glycoside hydrolase family 2 protein [Glycomyces xiaoerkulensis]|uniref:glycoside hydrolase family 2 protein n=1 Tax=Glycomyces xiaoerkulensis TaxID=2038139 RepID=UPI001E4AD2D0|nr:glycoside hydrolase family 2 TIM barrel-domain containing protein [Glycomyces xiaoerkulensis]